MQVPKGFRFAAAECGLKKRGGLDLGLLLAEVPAVAAAVFTTNLVKAAPVQVGIERSRRGKARAVLVNSGCANACTGEAGLEATRSTTMAVARLLNCTEDEIWPASTGVIGEVLDANKVQSKLSELVENAAADGYTQFADAIMTTDRWPKVARAAVPGSSGAQVLAIAKGAGMIQPDLAKNGELHATMLAFAITDATCTHEALATALERAVKVSFNAATVDGDTSTNDSVFVLASGLAGSALASELTQAFTEAFCELARSIVADGEGSEHLIELTVTGLSTEHGASQIAKTIANSLLVKTALAGCDPNWGRILAAAGRAGTPFDPALARISIGDVTIVERGQGVGADAEARAKAIMQKPKYELHVKLGTGPGEARRFMTELGHAYVDVNASYRS